MPTPFNTQVTITRVDPAAAGRVVIYTGVPALKCPRADGSMTWRLKAAKLLGDVEPGDRLDADDGDAWEVTRAARGGNATVPFWLCEVKPAG